MNSKDYFSRAEQLFNTIRESQVDNLHKAASLIAGSVGAGGWAYLFGSGHSVIPVMDIFPRYGSFVGFRPLLDPRLMWSNVIGPGGAPELLWLERQEGYIRNFLDSYDFSSKDCLVAFSHGGLNAAAIEAASYVREHGTKVIAVTSLQNYRQARAKHSSGKKLADLADVVIDNCVPPEDALVDIGRREKIGAGSTLSVVVISMALVTETAAKLEKRGFPLEVFVSPNVPGVERDHNRRVFDSFHKRVKE